MLASSGREDLSRDARETIIRENTRPTQTEITSDKTKVLNALLSHQGKSQVARLQFEMTLSCLTSKSIKDELINS